MKRIMQMVVVAAALVASCAVSNNVSAAGTCQVGFTGPDSNNLCTSTTAYTCSAVNDTTVQVAGQSGQVAVSGDAKGGGASTGSATNDNGVTFNVEVKNTTCSVVATVPATTPPTTPTAPAKPAATPSQPTPVVQAPQKLVATTLPNTSSASPLAAVAGVMAALGAVAVAARVAVSVYQRVKS